MNISIVIATIKFIKDSEKFDQLFPIIKIILIPSSVPFLNFLFKKSVVLQTSIFALKLHSCRFENLPIYRGVHVKAIH